MINLTTNQDTHESVWRASRSAGLQVPEALAKKRTRVLLAAKRLDVGGQKRAPFGSAISGCGAEPESRANGSCRLYGIARIFV